MKGQAKKKGSIKRGQPRSSQPAKKKKRKQSKGNSLAIAYIIYKKGSAYKKKRACHLYSQQRNVMSEQISL